MSLRCISRYFKELFRFTDTIRSLRPVASIQLVWCILLCGFFNLAKVKVPSHRLDSEFKRNIYLYIFIYISIYVYVSIYRYIYVCVKACKYKCKATSQERNEVQELSELELSTWVKKINTRWRKRAARIRLTDKLCFMHQTLLSMYIIEKCYKYYQFKVFLSLWQVCKVSEIVCKCCCVICMKCYSVKIVLNAKYSSLIW